MSRDILTVIQSRMGTFSKSQKLIGRYILDNYDKAAFMTAARMGQAVHTSESTVVASSRSAWVCSISFSLSAICRFRSSICSLIEAYWLFRSFK